MRLRHRAPTVAVPSECGAFEAESRNGYFANEPLMGPRVPYQASRSLAVVPGSVVGRTDLAAVLAIDCPGSGGNNEIRLLDPTTDAVVASITPTAGGNWRGFAYRGERGDLIGLSSEHGTGLFSVYRIAVSAPSDDPLTLSGPSQGTAELLFDFVISTDQLATGITWDAAAGSVKVVLDTILPTDTDHVPQILTLTESGASVALLDVDTTNCTGNASPGGILASGEELVVACNRTSSVPGGFQILSLLSVDSTTGVTDSPPLIEPTEVSPSNPMGDYDVVTADIECDTLTASNLEKTLLTGMAMGCRLV